jgi:hypothetical protein
MGFGVVAYAFLCCRICVSVMVVASYGGYIGRCTVCSGVPALIGLFRPVCLSVCLSVFNLSVYHFSIDLIGWPIRLPALLFPASPPSFVDSLDSELWYHLDAELLLWLRTAPRPLGSLSGSFHHAERAPRVISSLAAESPTILKLSNIVATR